MSLKMNYSATNLEVKKPGLPPSSVSQLAQSNLLVKAKKKRRCIQCGHTGKRNKKYSEIPCCPPQVYLLHSEVKAKGKPHQEVPSTIDMFWSMTVSCVR